MLPQFYISKHKQKQVIRCRLTKYIFFPLEVHNANTPHESITYVNSSYTVQSEIYTQGIPPLRSLVASINPLVII